jgi:hypothetical protein
MRVDRRARWIAGVTFVFVSLAAAHAGAQTPPPAPAYEAPPPGAPQPPPPPEYQAPPPGAPQPPAPYPYGPPPYGNPYYANPNPYVLNPQSMYAYESAKKQPALAIVLEIVVPGVGSIYADHVVGALITWGLEIGGFVLVVRGWADTFNNSVAGNPNSSSVETEVWLGLGLILAGRIYGLVDAYSSSKDYNLALAQRLGLPPSVALAPAPIKVAGTNSVAWGPALTLRF